jgi:nucleoid DNA-binding protein
MEDIIEVTNDIIMSQKELCAIVSANTKVDEKEVKLVVDSFIDLFLKKLKL